MNTTQPMPSSPVQDNQHSQQGYGQDKRQDSQQIQQTNSQPNQQTIPQTKAQAITSNQIKDIKTAFATLKPQKVTLDGNRSMTVKEAIIALAPTLERMKKRGFDIAELVEKLHEKGIAVKAPTLMKYLNECRRGKRKGTDTSSLKTCKT